MLASRLGFLKALVMQTSVALACAAYAQTYQVGAASEQPATSSSATQQSSLGWGSNIQNARLAHAAEVALQQSHREEALALAERAAQAAPNDPELWFLLGYAARLNGKFDQSIDAYNRGLRIRPNALDGRSGLAQDYSLTGKNADAERLLKDVIAQDPRRISDALLLGDMYMREKDFGSAVGVLERAERTQPSSRAEMLLALAYRQEGKPDAADRYLRMAIQRDPHNSEIERSMAGYYRDEMHYADAIHLLQSISNPKPDVVAELAYTYQLDGKAKKAAQLYAQAANASPRDLDLQLSAAENDIAVGSIKEADMFASRAKVIDRDDYRLHVILGEIAKTEHRDEDAVDEYRDAIAHLPSAPHEGKLYAIQLHMDLFDLYTEIGNEEAAHSELQTAQSAIDALGADEKSGASFLRLRAMIRSDSGQLSDAMADIQAALRINSSDPASLQLDGDILVKMRRVEAAIEVYNRILKIDPTNRYALISLGYASRADAHEDEAERYFLRLEQVDPSSYVPYLALGDLYTAEGDYAKAQVSYREGYRLAPQNALIVAGGMNAAIEAHRLDIAKTWSSRVTRGMEKQPQVLRERERYLSFVGRYQESAAVGQEALKALPKDRDVIVYLGYDFLHLGRYDELLELTAKYQDVLPHEPDIPLLQGYVHKHQGLKEQARLDFTRVLERDPSVVTAYVNRGYMLNDLHQSRAAAADFEEALHREPNDGEAHLGLAYADLDLSHPQAALREVDAAEKALGNSRDVHVIRATAYGREDNVTKAAAEYRAALDFTPDDAALHMGLADSLFSLRRYRDAIGELEIAGRLSPDHASADALLARSYARLGERDSALKAVAEAERQAQTLSPPERSKLFLATGEAYSDLGDETGAMTRFRNALEIPGGDRVQTRLAIAEIMARQDRFEDANRQIALGWMEAAAGDTTAPTGSEDIAAADVFRATHDFGLSQRYLERAKSAGAPDQDVRIGLANTYLALGETAKAQAELAAASTEGDGPPSYQYLLAQANLFQQEHRGAQALTSFAQASRLEGDDEAVEQSMLQAGANEGMRVTPQVSWLSEFSVEPVYEDSTVYVLDAKLDASFAVPVADSSLLPPPRSSLQTQGISAFHLHLGNLPTAGGFFQVRNARGDISVPATNSIVQRNTTDYAFNVGLAPVIHLGSDAILLNGGVQETLRRDSLSPIEMNQNLFRAFMYMSTSSFFNALSVSGYVIREAGPFTESNLKSRSLTGAIDFRIGAPWGKTALVTGWGSNDQTFSPVNFENYYTSSYVGLERRFSDRLSARAVVEDLRSWRVVGRNSGIAQNLRPAGTIDFSPKPNWHIEVSSAYSDTRSFHAYDAIQNGFSISYGKPLQRKWSDNSGSLMLKYPIRFSAGLQDETFFNFTGSGAQQLRPYVQINIF